MYVHHQICLVLTPCLPGSHVVAIKLDQHSHSNCMTAFLFRTTVMDRHAIANLATASAALSRCLPCLLFERSSFFVADSLQPAFWCAVSGCPGWNILVESMQATSHWQSTQV